MAKQKIFFSYSRVDGSAFALKLAIDLKRKGFDVWIDQEDIRAGLDWDTEIENALESCDCVLFLETEKSVVSNNVLDEVYFALDQKKKVIPVVVVDSKTPYRLNRLQNINFTGNYETGLAQLVNELEGNVPAIAYPVEGPSISSTPDKTVHAKNYRALFIVTGLAILIAAAIVFSTKNKSAAPIGTRSQSDSGLMNEMVAGDWQLIEVDPKAQSLNGYLKIEALNENKVAVKAYVQFYYSDSKAPLYLTVFNSFVGCPSCALSRDMKLKVEDIAVGSANSNTSIQGTATLQFADDSTAVVKVARTVPVKLANELTLDPFEYVFRFRKND